MNSKKRTRNEGEGVLIADRTEDRYEEILFDRRQIYLTDEIYEVNTMDVIRKLLILDKQSKDPITLYINSCGGEIGNGMAIIDMIHKIKSPVKTVCVSLCASMAAIILMNGEKGFRYSMKSATIMLHRASWQMDSDYDKHQAQKLKYCQKEATTILKEIAKITKKKVKTVETDIESGLWLSARQAIKYNLIDKIY